MAVPDYQTLMAPVLLALTDGKPRTRAELMSEVADLVGLTDADLAETLPSGNPIAKNRVGWSITYLKQAGLLAHPRRGIIEITDRGRKVLDEHPDRVDNDVLARFPEFRAFRQRSRDADATKTTNRKNQPSPSGTAAEATPREKLNSAITEANEATATEILQRVRAADPVLLERLVLRLLNAMGYGGSAGSTHHVGGPGDAGVDGVIRQDPLGLDQIYIQVKRYAEDRSVSRPDIQAFAGALQGAQADRGIFVTTSRFTQEALDFAERVNARLVLIDGITLARHMVDHNIGAQVQETYVLKRIDEDFFEEL